MYVRICIVRVDLYGLDCIFVVDRSRGERERESGEKTTCSLYQEILHAALM